MIERLSPFTRNFVLLIIGGLSAWFLWKVRAVLNPLIFGYLLAYVLHPMVLRLERKGWSRKAAVNMIFLLGLVGATVMTIALAVQGRRLLTNLASPGSELRERVALQVEGFISDNEELIRTLIDAIPTPGGDDDAAGDGDAGEVESSTLLPEGESDTNPEQDAVASSDVDSESPLDSDLAETTSDLYGALRHMTAGLLERLFTGDTAMRAGEVGLRATRVGWDALINVFGSVVGFMTFVLLLPVYSYFLLFELGRIHRFVLRYMPRRDRARFSRIGGEIGDVLSSFFRGRLLVCLVKGMILALGLALAGIDYALLLGLASGFLSLIPFVGPLIGAAAALLIGLIDHSLVGSFVRIAIVFGVGEVIEGYILIPKVLGDTLGLHPVVVLASVFVGGAALGMFGFLVALPLTAAIVILAKEFVLPALASLADEPG